MRKTFRVLSYLFFIAAAVRLWFDFSSTTLKDRKFSMYETGRVWAEFHRDSLLALQPGVERYLSPAIWEWGISPILQAPLFPILVVFGIFFRIAGMGAPKLR